MATRTIPLAHTVHTACPHDCPDTCAIRTTTEHGRAIAFEPVKKHPITKGWLCAKVRPYLDRVYHPDRLTTPLRRTGAKGEGHWEAISWDEALDRIVDHRPIVDRQQVLVRDGRERPQARAEAPGEDDAPHHDSS